MKAETEMTDSDFNAAKRKVRRRILISGYLYDSATKSGRISIADCQMIIWNIRDGQIPEIPPMNDLIWKPKDGEIILRDSLLWVGDQQKEYAEAIYKALIEPLPTSDVPTQRCSYCGKEKALTEFHEGQKYCIPCKKIVNRQRRGY